MRLKPEARDRILTEFATRLNGGAMVIYEANPSTNPLAAPLASVPFDVFASTPVTDGTVGFEQVDPVVILKSGEARWAELVTATGEAIAEMPVRALDNPDAERGAILVDRTDFHRGGTILFSQVTLSLPLQA